MTLTRRFVLPALAVFICAGTGLAQTPAGLLERGIFLEETAGDFDGAIRVYRQILAANGLSRDVGAQAETRLAELLQRRGQARQSATPGVVSPLPAPQTSSAILITPTIQAEPGCCGMFSGNYDETRPVTVIGKIISVQWMNPLTVLFVDGTDGHVWGLTTASPNTMMRGGANRNTFKLGEEVIVEGYLAKGAGDNCPAATLPNACETIFSPSGCTTLTFPDGRNLVVGAQPCPEPTADARHASARSISAIDGRNLFDRPAMEKAAAAAGQVPGAVSPGNRVP